MITYLEVLVSVKVVVAEVRIVVTRTVFVRITSFAGIAKYPMNKPTTKAMMRPKGREDLHVHHELSARVNKRNGLIFINEAKMKVDTT